MFRFFISSLYTMALLLRLSYTDIKSKELENIHIIAILLAFCGISVNMQSRISGLLFPIIMTPFYGFGDILLFSALGFTLGLSNLVLIIALSCLLAGIYALYLLLFKKEKRNRTFPFAPFISISYLVFFFRTMVNYLGK